MDRIQRGLNRWQSEWVNPTISNLDRGISLDTGRVAADGARRLAPVSKQLLDLLEADRAKSQAALHDTEQQMRRMLIFALVVALMVAGAVLLVTREVTRLLEQPVRQLIEASERVSRGEFDLTLPPKADNEFGVLSHSFAHMTTALRQEREELAALNRFSEAVTQCTSEQEIHEHVLYSIRERFRPRQVIIFTHDPREFPGSCRHPGPVAGRDPRVAHHRGAAQLQSGAFGPASPGERCQRRAALPLALCASLRRAATTAAR